MGRMNNAKEKDNEILQGAVRLSERLDNIGSAVKKARIDQ